MTVKEFATKHSACSFFEKEDLASRLCEEGIIDYDRWLKAIGKTEDDVTYDDDSEFMDIIWEGIVEGNQKFLEPYLDEKGEFDYYTFEYDSDELFNFVYSIVKEKMKVEFPKLIEYYETD